jgi:HD-like signal output (HDOD) protein
MDTPTPMDPKLQALDIDVPAPPQSLAKLATVLADENVDLFTVGALIENDMALGAAVMKAVNAPVYALKGRVQSVQQAVTYLGIREIAAVAYEIGLRAVFPQAPELGAVWERASLRGMMMGRLAHSLAMEAWGAHTAGLFEECGKAVLFRHDPATYRALMNDCATDAELVEAERRTFGISHDELGARLCESWGLSAAAVASVRHHVAIHETHRLPRVSHRYVCVLSALANALMHEPETLEDVAMALAPQAMLDQTSLLRGVRRVKEKIDEALAEA